MKLSFSVLACLFFGHAGAQILIGSGGDAYTTTTNHVVLSIGETFIPTETASSNVLTYGFNQPIPGTIGILESGAIEVEVYPNPTSNFVRITTVFDESIRATLWSMDGRLIQELTIDPNHPIIDLRMLPASVYVLRMDMNNMLSEVQIIKR